MPPQTQQPTQIIREPERLIAKWMSRLIWFASFGFALWVGVLARPFLNEALVSRVTPRGLPTPVARAKELAELERRLLNDVRAEVGSMQRSGDRELERLERLVGFLQEDLIALSTPTSLEDREVEPKSQESSDESDEIRPADQSRPFGRRNEPR